MPGPANDDHFHALAQPVRVLQLNAGAHKVRRPGGADKPDEIWLGSAWDPAAPDDADLLVYVRVAGLKPSTAELLCGVVGRALGLPVPEPFLVHIPRGTLPRSRLLDPVAPECMAIASHNVGGTNFVKMLNRRSEAALRLLLSWEHLVPVATFDEWMANPDRNLGNILFAAGSLWLIDHAEALGGAQARHYSLAELTERAFGNRLAQILESFQQPQRVAALRQAGDWLSHPAGALDLPSALQCTGMSAWHSEAEHTQLLDFVRERLTLTHALLCNRLGHPQLPLGNPSRSAPGGGARSSPSRPASPRSRC
jgi:hypothetical protein